MSKASSSIVCLSASCALVTLVAAVDASAGVVAYYRFEPGARTTDSSGNARALTKVDTVNEIARPATGNGSSFPATVGGLPNEGVISPTGAGYYTAADDNAFTDNSFTIEAFVNAGTIATNTTEFIAGHWGTGDARSYGLGISQAASGTGKLRLLLDDDGNGPKTGFFLDTDASTIAPDTDYYVAAVVDINSGGGTADSITLYIKDLTNDGPLTSKLFSQTAGNLTTGGTTPSTDVLGVFNGTGPFAVAATGAGTSLFSGILDEVRLSDAALTSNQLMVAVPEPGSAAALGVGLSATLLGRRRSSKR